MFDSVLFSWIVLYLLINSCNGALPKNVTIRRVNINEPLLYQKNGTDLKRILTVNMTQLSRGKRFGFPTAPAAPQVVYYPAPPAPAPPPPAPIIYAPPPETTTVQYIQPSRQPFHPYPLPSCYTGSSGFMCCNAQLEQVMLRSFDELKNSRPDWSSANINQITTQVQRNAEHEFGIQFEVIAGVGDYASKSHFYSDKICKIYWQCRYILAYATPRDGVPYCTTNTLGNSAQGQCSGPLPNLPPLLSPPSSYPTASYDLPQRPRPEPNPSNQQPTIEVQPGDTETPHLNGPVPASPDFDPSTSNSVSPDAETDAPTSEKHKDDPNGNDNNVEEKSDGSTTSYGTQTASPPPLELEEVQTEVRRAEGRVAAYGHKEQTQNHIN
ncbi:Ground-like domain-containing protein [Aphelenchoides bicaudatus]|nr:Ground-like domain-containing protein [Aphelenchoides bicaudatus]